MASQSALTEPTTSSEVEPAGSEISVKAWKDGPVHQVSWADEIACRNATRMSPGSRISRPLLEAEVLGLKPASARKAAPALGAKSGPREAGDSSPAGPKEGVRLAEAVGLAGVPDVLPVRGASGSLGRVIEDKSKRAERRAARRRIDHAG